MMTGSFMAFNKPVTNGMKSLMRSVSHLADDKAKLARNIIINVRDHIDDFRHSHEPHDMSLRHAAMEGLKRIIDFPAQAIEVLSKSDVGHSLHHVGRQVPEVALLGLGGLVGASLLSEGSQTIYKKLNQKPKKCHKPLFYIAPAVIMGMLLSEQLQNIQFSSPSEEKKAKTSKAGKAAKAPLV